MTIEDLIESGIEFQGVVRVAVWDGEHLTEVYEGDGLDLGKECDEWYESYPITYIYPSLTQDHGFTIEVDGEEQS